MSWAVLFTAMHGYWFLGGRYGLGDSPSSLPAAPHDAVSWVSTVFVAALFPIGIALPAILLQDRAHGAVRRALVLLLWAGCVLLLLRGLSGLLDDLVRDIGLSNRGITGLSNEELLGRAHPSGYTMFSVATVDACFALGGVLYGWAALACRARPQSTGR